MAYEIVYFATLAATKLSILTFYTRLFPTRPFKLAARIMIAVVIAWFIATTLVSIFSCNPVRAFWTHEPGSTCIVSVHFYIANAVPNIITDAIILALPIHMIWKLHTSNWERVALTFIFLLGSLYVPENPRPCLIVLIKPVLSWPVLFVYHSSIRSPVPTLCVSVFPCQSNKSRKWSLTRINRGLQQHGHLVIRWAIGRRHQCLSSHYASSRWIHIAPSMAIPKPKLQRIFPAAKLPPRNGWFRAQVISIGRDGSHGHWKPQVKQLLLGWFV